MWGTMLTSSENEMLNMLPQRDGSQISCESCKKDINGLARIRCAECTEKIDVCLSCFSTGAETKRHKSDHPYRVMDSLSFPLFSEDWTAAEELTLVDHVRKLGLGSWDEISDALHRKKTPAQVREHYLDLYLGRHGSVLPPKWLRKNTTNGSNGSGGRGDGKGLEEIVLPMTEPSPRAPFKKGEKVSSADLANRKIADLGTGHVIPEMYKYPPAWGLVANGQAGAGGGGGSGSGSEELGGWGGVGGGKRKREEDGFAEEFGKSVPFGEGRKALLRKKVKEETLIKAWVEKLPGGDLTGYWPLRGDFEVEHDNDAEKLLADMEFTCTDHPSERQLKLDVISVYNQRLDERERRKKFVMDHKLLDFKKQNATKKRLKEDRDLIARCRPFARFQSPEEHEELIEGLLLAKRLRARIEQLQGYREKGITTLEEANEFEAQKKRRTEEIAAKKHKEAAGYLYDTYNTKNGSNRERSNRYHNRAKDGDGLVTPGEGGKEEKEDQPLDLTDAPGVDLLSNEERELCSTLMMLPNYYLAVKNVMVQAFTKQGYLRKASANKLVTLETKRTEKMYDFFVSCGLVNSEPKRPEYFHDRG